MASCSSCFPLSSSFSSSSSTSSSSSASSASSSSSSSSTSSTSSSKGSLSSKANLPILPIRTRVLFPNCLLQLNIGRASTVSLVENHLLDTAGSFKQNTLIGVFTLKPSDSTSDDIGGAEGASGEIARHCYEVGTLARVTHFQKAKNAASGGHATPSGSSDRTTAARPTVPPHKYVLVVQGIRRIRLRRTRLQFVDERPNSIGSDGPAWPTSTAFWLAEIDLLPNLTLPKESLPSSSSSSGRARSLPGNAWAIEAVRQLKEQFGEVLKLLDNVGRPFVKRGQELLRNLRNDNVLELADIIASIVEASVDERAAVLSSMDAQERLQLVNDLLRRQIEYFQVSQQVQSKIQENMEGSRRKFYLREQLKVIKKELGEGEDGGPAQNEIDELAEKLAMLNLPPEAEKSVQKDLQRLKRMQPAQPEFSVILSYLEFVVTLPWHNDGLSSNDRQKDAEPTDTQIGEKREHNSATMLGDEAKASISQTSDANTNRPKVTSGTNDKHENICLSVRAQHINDSEVDLVRARQVLDEDHFGLETVKKRVLQYLAVCSLRQDTAGPILCLVGPPGVGKTSLGKSVARALSRKFHRLCLGGVRDEAEIRGHRRTYIGALPGQILQAFARTGTNKPVVLLDEVDKLGSDARGDPSAALLEVLDPAQNRGFKDHYLAVPFDISRALFIATANDLNSIPRPLLDRMEVIQLPSYSVDEKMAIARDHLVPKMELQHGLCVGSVSITDTGLRTMIREYTQEAGVRTLERKVAAVCRHVALARASAQELTGSPVGKNGRTRPAAIDDSFIVTRALLPEILGPCTFAPTSLHVGNAATLPVAGVALGLAWTPFGGELLTIETAKMAGSGRLILTGRLGETMRESAQIALGWIRSHAALLGLGVDRHIDGDHARADSSWVASKEKPKSLLDGTDVHVHFPAGAIQKDGPSAGVAMTAALVSLFLDRPLPANIAMTGEISLSGTVLPVGGIKEKVVAAHAAGCQGVIVPHRNGGDLVDVPTSTQSELEVLTAERIEEVLEGLFGPFPLSSLHSESSIKVQKLEESQMSRSAEQPIPSSNDGDHRVANRVDGVQLPSNVGNWVPPPSATVRSIRRDTVCFVARSSL